MKFFSFIALSAAALIGSSNAVPIERVVCPAVVYVKPIIESSEATSQLHTSSALSDFSVSESQSSHNMVVLSTRTYPCYTVPGSVSVGKSEVIHAISSLESKSKFLAKQAEDIAMPTGTPVLPSSIPPLAVGAFEINSALLDSAHTQPTATVASVPVSMSMHRVQATIATSVNTVTAGPSSVAIDTHQAPATTATLVNTATKTAANTVVNIRTPVTTSISATGVTASVTQPWNQFKNYGECVAVHGTGMWPYPVPGDCYGVGQCQCYEGGNVGCVC